jgi:hypothetical protein
MPSFLAVVLAFLLLSTPIIMMSFFFMLRRISAITCFAFSLNMSDTANKPTNLSSMKTAITFLPSDSLTMAFAIGCSD